MTAEELKNMQWIDDLIMNNFQPKTLIHCPNCGDCNRECDNCPTCRTEPVERSMYGR